MKTASSGPRIRPQTPRNVLAAILVVSGVFVRIENIQTDFTVLDGRRTQPSINFVFEATAA
jgi:hypothetical protein